MGNCRRAIRLGRATAAAGASCSSRRRRRRARGRSALHAGPAAIMAAAAGAVSPATLRYTTYALLSGQHLVTLVTRVALPYVVTFIAAEPGLLFSPTQRATLLSSFTAGYVTMQIPGGYLARCVGNKMVCLMNNIGMASVLLALPAAARTGRTAPLAAMLALVGILQGPLMVAVSDMTAQWLPPPASPERPWAMLATRLGSHLSKVVGPALTPWLAGRLGWVAATRVYAATFGLSAVLWQVCATESPPPVTAARDTGASNERPVTAPPPLPPPPLPPNHHQLLPFTPRLLIVRSQLAILGSQVCHDLLEFQTLATWSPLFFHQAHGVPLARVGRYTIWPMVVGMVGKFFCTGYESVLLRQGMPRLRIRKLSNTIASVLACGGSLGFLAAPTPLLACAAYCGVCIGGCFDYPGFVGNALEGRGSDAGIMGAFSNTFSWVLVLVFGRLFAALRQWAGGSWLPLLLGCVQGCAAY
jgi:MFS family permease